MRTYRVWLGGLLTISRWFGCTSMLDLDGPFDSAKDETTALVGGMGGTGGTGSVGDSGTAAAGNAGNGGASAWPSCDAGVPHVCGQGACMQTVGACEPCPFVVGNPFEHCDGLDDDCDGAIDNGCACENGAMQPCYGGPSNTRGVGACVEGAQTCTNGQWGECVGHVLPLLHDGCDGEDNDCDEKVDEDVAEVGTACDTGLPGICGTGVNECNANGAIVCRQTLQPSVEICDGKDNDCNGETDEESIDSGQWCSTGKLGECGEGTYACIKGNVICHANQDAMQELCDGKDNDCNGIIDNGNPGSAQSCDSGKKGICAPGSTACENGKIVCNQNNQPGPEFCGDTLDNDCDGVVGNGCACIPGQTKPCCWSEICTEETLSFTGNVVIPDCCDVGVKTCNASGTAFGPCMWPPPSLPHAPI